ncbi:flagellar basal body-associated protein FliL [Inquilinus sp. NPDC058860]|uniref:flagellar basal body-associated FliL family protein n=1 Tax=Inquilinus sp. NPDC058860 TaxID=3346652 RepID=UPI0036AA4870
MAGRGFRRQAKGFAVAGAFLAGVAAGWWWHAAGPFGGPAAEPAGLSGRIEAGPFIVPEPAGADGRRGYLMVRLALEPADRAGADAVAEHLPHVRDAAVEAILALSPGWFDGVELRPDRAGSELRLLVNRNLGAPLVARAVLEVQRRLPAPAG